MKSLSGTAQIYITIILLIGSGLLGWQLSRQNNEHLWVLLFSCAIAALLQTLKAVGVTTRTSYNLSWILYGFAFVFLGAPAALFVILSAHLVEWIRYRYVWYIQCFNIASFTIVVSIAEFVYALLNPGWTAVTFRGALAILLVLVLFTGLNHLLVGVAIHLARGQSLGESGVFGLMTLMLDFGLLSMGAMAALIWVVNPYAITFVFFQVYLLYNALRVPALQRQVETDPKTGLFNARYFTEKLNDELVRAQRFKRPLTLVMADLDLLREVNNKYGHLAGDVVLNGVANILKEAGRDYDLVARFGGEEFALLMPETTVLEAQIVVEETRRVIEAAEFTVSTNSTPLKVTMSFGVAECREKVLSGDDLILCADLAVYQAKLNGRNQVCIFTDEQSAISNSTFAQLKEQASNARPKATRLNLNKIASQE
jgi:diguanylate cyclase (GGDEF)-like protein